jgi:hypothetical protein
MRKIKLDRWAGGLAFGEFADAKDRPCSIQESSRLDIPTIAIGLNESNRMELTQEHVKRLLPLLQKFAETGELE